MGRKANASDPAATGNALSALNSLNQSALQPDLQGPLLRFCISQPPFKIRLQRNYNPILHMRGIVLKGNGWAETWPMWVFMAVVMLTGLKRYQKTLD